MEPFLTVEQVTDLQRAHKSCKNKKKADRVKALLLLNDGYTYEEVARILLLDDSTVRRYQQLYEAGGVKELWQGRYIGKQSDLTNTQELFLKLHLRIRTYRTAQEIAEYIAARFGVLYSTGGTTKLLHRLGFVYKKPKVVPGKADAEKQAVFLKEYKKLKATKNVEDIIYFVDGCHPHHNAIPSHGWIEKGTNKYLKTNSGRQRLNFNGALNSEDVTDVEVLSEETLNADAMIRLCERLLTKHATGHIYLILDNARYYRAKKVQIFVKENPRIKLMFLPSYSPNLNLIERLWLFFQKNVLYNRYYKDVKIFEQVSLHFFKNLKYHRSELQTLLTDSFQVVPA